MVWPSHHGSQMSHTILTRANLKLIDSMTQKNILCIYDNLLFSTFQIVKQHHTDLMGMCLGHVVDKTTNKYYLEPS